MSDVNVHLELFDIKVQLLIANKLISDKQYEVDEFQKKLEQINVHIEELVRKANLKSLRAVDNKNFCLISHRN